MDTEVVQGRESVATEQAEELPHTENGPLVLVVSGTGDGVSTTTAGAPPRR